MLLDLRGIDKQSIGHFLSWKAQSQLSSLESARIISETYVRKNNCQEVPCFLAVCSESSLASCRLPCNFQTQSLAFTYHAGKKGRVDCVCKQCVVSDTTCHKCCLSQFCSNKMVCFWTFYWVGSGDMYSPRLWSKAYEGWAARHSGAVVEGKVLGPHSVHTGELKDVIQKWSQKRE